MIHARVVELTSPQIRGLSAFKPKKEFSFDSYSASAKLTNMHGCSLFWCYSKGCRGKGQCPWPEVGKARAPEFTRTLPSTFPLLSPARSLWEYCIDLPASPAGPGKTRKLNGFRSFYRRMKRGFSNILQVNIRFLSAC